METMINTINTTNDGHNHMIIIVKITIRKAKSQKKCKQAKIFSNIKKHDGNGENKMISNNRKTQKSIIIKTKIIIIIIMITTIII